MNSRLFTVVSALASGALYAFANVGFGYWPLTFLCFVPLLLAIERTQRVRTAAGLGFACGAMIYFVGYSWLLALTEGFVSGGMASSIGIWGAYGVFLALHFMAFAAFYAILRKIGVVIPLAATLAILAVESLQLNLFPFYLGASLIHSLYFPQAAELGGVYLLTAVAMLSNASLVAAILSFQQLRMRSGSYLFLAALSISFLHYYGMHHNISSQPHENVDVAQPRALTIGLVQSDLYGISQTEQRARAHAHHLDLSRRLLEKGPVDLLVWPEAAYGNGVRGELPLDGQLIQQELTTPILFGSTRYVQLDGISRTSNSVFLVDEQRKLSGVYSKNKLIPFSEYLPFESLLTEHEDMVRKVFPEYQRFVAGQSLKALELAGHKISTPICYEAVMPDLVREMVVQNQSELLVSVANDSWFGESKEPYIHLAMARLRAIEHRRWFVRATNGGISAVINPSGRVVNSVPLGEEGVRRSSVQWRSEITLYTLFGNWTTLLVLLLSFFNLILVRKLGLTNAWNERLSNARS
jgi:apolipoprotein N-acyltransferase